MIEAILIDSREPEWVKALRFDGLPTSVVELPAGDVQAVTDDGHLLSIERKTPDDLVGTLREERLYPQMARLAEPRLEQALGGQPATHWPYLMITGALTPSPSGKLITERGETGWAYSAVQGALLSIQEMGVFVTHCQGDADFEKAILRLGSRKREGIQNILPARPGAMLGPGHALLASLPGIGPEKAIELMTWAGGAPAFALVGLTDLQSPAPVGQALRKRIRQMLGLKDHQHIDVWLNQDEDVILQVLEKSGG